MTDVRWGILATGLIARLFTSDLKTTGRTVTAVGSRREESARAFAAEFGIPHAHGSYEALMADDEVDIVYIATPHPGHAEAALMALDHGKHVLIEKPLTLNAAEAEAIRVRAAERGLLAMEAMWTRYLPHMVRARQLIAEGAIGEVRVLTTEHMQSLPTDAGHRLNALELGGGALLDLGIYPVSFAVDILGLPTSVRALARISEHETDTEVGIVMQHPGGALSTSVSSSRTQGGNPAVIAGTTGRIEVDGTWYAPTTMRVIATDGTLVEEFDGRGEGRGMQHQAAAAEALIATGRTDSDQLPIAESVAIMRVLDDIRAQIGVRYPSE